MFESLVPNWLHRVELIPTSERLAAIIDTANEVASTANGQSALGVVDLAFSGGSDAAFALLSDAVRVRDATFGCAKGDLESRLVAAVTVAAMLESNSDTASNAAYAVLSEVWRGRKSEIEDLAGFAREALARRSEAHRARNVVAITTDMAGALKAVPTFDPDGGGATHEEVNRVTASVTKGLETVKRSFDQIAARVNTQLGAVDEELDVLWWAFSNYSSTSRASWEAVPADPRPIVMAAEFFRHLRFPVEPQSVDSVLSRLLGTSADQKIVLRDSIEALTDDQFNLPSFENQQALPVLTSIRECREFDRKKAWIASAARWGVDASQETTARALAIQTLGELVLARNLLPL